MLLWNSSGKPGRPSCPGLPFDPGYPGIPISPFYPDSPCKPGGPIGPGEPEISCNRCNNWRFRSPDSLFLN